jgi:hypothetical protein
VLCAGSRASRSCRVRSSGSVRRAVAFKDAYRMLFKCIGIFTALPVRSLHHLTLQNKLDEIGRT